MWTYSTFEMKVLLYRNRELIQNLKELIGKKMDDEEMKERAMQLLEQMFGDLDVEEDQVQEIVDDGEVASDEEDSIEDEDLYQLDLLDELDQEAEAAKAVLEEMRNMSLEDDSGGKDDDEEVIIDSDDDTDEDWIPFISDQSVQVPRVSLGL